MSSALPLSLPAMLCCVAYAADPHPIVTYSKQAKFADARDDVKAAIEGKGLVTDYESHVNRMLERTGKDAGSARKLYTDAQGSCSAARGFRARRRRPTRRTLPCALFDRGLCHGAGAGQGLRRLSAPVAAGRLGRVEGRAEAGRGAARFRSARGDRREVARRR